MAWFFMHPIVNNWKAKGCELTFKVIQITKYPHLELQYLNPICNSTINRIQLLMYRKGSLLSKMH